MAGREKNCKWYFADQPNGQEIGPNNAMEQNFRQHPYSSLIRESIQNSLDAVLDKSKPVRMHYSFREMDGIEYPSFFDLQHHIQGCLDYFPNNLNAKSIYEPMMKFFEGDRYHEKIGYIRVSDYNTKGMDYDEHKTDSPFYAFVRSAGVSAKDDNSAGGSFGFGKAAYFLMSPISSIIVSTCTQEYDKYFEGIASLCTHMYNGTKKMAVGYYDDSDGRPICDEVHIPVKFRRSEPGTDINILGFDFKYKDEAIEDMTKAVLRNFWMAIYNNKLVVQIDEVEISSENIVELMELYFPEEEDKTRKTNYYNPRPYFDAVRLSDSDKYHTSVHRELPLLGNVSLFINKSKSAPDKIIFMRKTQMLIYSKKNRTSYGMYAVFHCDDEKGNDILRHLENPAHDDWNPNNWKVQGHTYGVGRSVMKEIDDFITEALKSVFLVKDKAAINIKGLEEFLYIPTSYEEDDLDSESFVGEPTGQFKDDGNSFTTDGLNDNTQPNITPISTDSSHGQIRINKPSSGAESPDGSLRSGRGPEKKKTKTKGIQKPGDARQRRKEDEDGEDGIFATPIDIRYRTFFQVEGNKLFHYVILHSDEDIENIRLHFLSAGEDTDDELVIAETSEGTIFNNMVKGVSIHKGRKQLKVRFTDNMKHSLKLSAEELNEIQ